MQDRLAQLASIVAVILVWGAMSAVIGSSILPGPVDVAPRFAELITTGAFLEPLLESLVRTGVGFVVGFVSGIALGIVIAKVRWFEVAFTPLLDVALFAPTLVVIFLGIAIIGTQLLAVAIITGIAVAPNVAIYMRDVMRDFDPEMTAMADSYRAGRWQRVRDVYLPYLVPPMLAAARIGFSMAWKVVLLSEVFGFSGGLGFQIRINYGIYDLVSLLAWLCIFVIALLLIEQLIRSTEKTVVRWQP
ncbi:MAG TPA: ABC transporter permease subunit [Candidatus Saccharimonadales bacterium]|nr:ABC transporter permease subunit [Candidatus Saccharimonadales bacterium]